jgi:ferredoxin-type protein NapF
MSGASIERSRRAFLFGAQAEAEAEAEAHADTALRLPWALSAVFADLCTGCGDCVSACPEGIVALDDAQRAIVDFQRGAGLCSFCGACADVCREPIFSARTATPPWALKIGIGDDCLTREGVMCQTCRDACGDGAIRFLYMAGRIPEPQVDLDRCTGCGACVAPCPTAAIEIQRIEADADA